MLANAFDPLAKIFAVPLTAFYAATGSYAVSILLITVVVMLITTPLTLKSTKGMLEMQRLQPELKKLQAQHRGDRQKLNEEMMRLYQEHKVNPLASCFPLLLQMPVFIGMFTLLRGLTNRDGGSELFTPRIISKSSELYQDLSKSKQMLSWGFDLALSPREMFKESAGKGVLYILIVVLLAFLYWVQQRMVANRTVSPTMSAGQAKLMQYLPVAFAVFQIFFPMGLIFYYVWQTVLRILQQYYVTRRFYRGEGSLGAQAQAAGAAAREMSKTDKDTKSGGLFGAARAAAKDAQQAKSTQKPGAAGRPKGRPTPNRPTGAKKPTPGSGAKKPSGGGAKPSSGSSRPPAKPTKPQKPKKPGT